MAGKRSASDELNHDNWDKDEEPEERGTFQQASEDALKRRIIKTAKRRNPISSVRTNDEGEKKSVFSGFTGFQSKSSTNFSFLNDLTKKTDETPKANGTTNPLEPSTIVPFSFKANTNKNTNLLTTTKETKCKSDDYYAKLKGLNESVSKWIQSKVEVNPLISLQPIFKDYEKYLEDIEIEEKSKEENKVETSSVPSFIFKPPNSMPVPDSTSEKHSGSSTVDKKDANVPQFSFGSNASITSTSTAAVYTSSSTLPQFSFGSKTTTTSATTLSTSFSFASTTSATQSTSSFGFGSSARSFGVKSSANPTVEETKQNEDDNEEEPPKVEFTPVVEKDHVYTTRCKVFVKKDGTFGDRGVGNLYLKPIENSEKVQVIVRADTSLGNLLCNFILSENIPLKRMGKKDVMLVCLPNSDTPPPPVPVLFRLKSPEDADNLLETLEKYKK